MPTSPAALTPVARYIWNDDDLASVARIIGIMNPLNPQSADHIRFVAEGELKAPGYVGTGGWYVTAYRPAWAAADELHMLVTVMPFTVEGYLAKTGAI